MKQLKSIIALVAIPGALLAGPAEKMVIIEDPVCAVPFSGSVSAGYETDYIFRGVEFGQHAPWLGAEINFDWFGQTSVDAGVWYINPTEDVAGFDDELDVYLSFNFPLWVFDMSLGTTWYYFPELGGETLEGFLNVGYSVGDYFDLGLLSAYDETGEGWYFELSAGKSVLLTDCLALNLGAGVAYVDEYFGLSGWNHAFATAGLSYALTETATFDIYVGGNFPLEAVEDATGQDEKIHGGASITVSF